MIRTLCCNLGGYFVTLKRYFLQVPYFKVLALSELLEKYMKDLLGCLKSDIAVAISPLCGGVHTFLYPKVGPMGWDIAPGFFSSQDSNSSREYNMYK